MQIFGVANSYNLSDDTKLEEKEVLALFCGRLQFEITLAFVWEFNGQLMCIF